ncbi:MAG: hypothetical protein ABSB60_18605 [Terracidiphilus sp.]|jgi:hypothetical protein
MKQATAFSATILPLLFAAASIAAAQHDQQSDQRDRSTHGQQSQPQQQTRPAQPEHRQPTGRPVQAQPRPQPTYGGAYHGGVQSNGPTYGGVHHSGVPQQRDQVRGGFVQSRAGSWKDEHQSWTQRGGYNGYRIPDARFRLYFGREHFFRIYGLPLYFVGGMPRFQYDGYWVTIVDPWPESWGPNWYESDDVYLDNTGDGYYLYDRNYPDYPIAVTVSF